MPELQSETVVRSLRDGGQFGPSILGKTITGAEVLWGRSIAVPEPDVFCAELVGQRVCSVSRRGKHIVIHLTDLFLLFHLRMSGELRVDSLYNEKDDAVPLLSHDRVVLYFSDGHRLAFNNPRKFGRAWLVKEAVEIVGHLGPEPFSEELTPDRFYSMLQKHHRQIKSLLLDQTFFGRNGQYLHR